jgi:hypothetical protein
VLSSIELVSYSKDMGEGKNVLDAGIGRNKRESMAEETEGR